MKRPTLTKQRIIRAIGLRTGITDYAVAQVLETFIDVVTEEVLVGGRVEIENFIVIDRERRIRRADKTHPFQMSERADSIKYPKIRLAKKLRKPTILNPESEE